MSASAAPSTLPRQRGFSFVEILIVMGIIGVLAGLTTVIIGYWGKKGPQDRTANTIRKLTLQAQSWKQKFDRYPPSDPTKIHAIAGGARGVTKLPNTTNVGVESLVLSLTWDTFGSSAGLGDKERGNTDEDQLDKAVTQQGADLIEALDDWGRPLVYLLFTDYAKAFESPPTYMDANGNVFEPRPWKHSDESRGFAEANGFQIFSVGPDGEPNTADDIKSW
jgi:prepilin-type N-terminal cleavage/methylation domain-containing protein